MDTLWVNGKASMCIHEAMAVSKLVSSKSGDAHRKARLKYASGLKLAMESLDSAEVLPMKIVGFRKYRFVKRFET